MSENFLSRTRKLTPQNLFLSVLHLATSTNDDGMNQALQKTWQVQNLKLESTPVKSSLSEARDKVSYEFFKDIFQNDLKQHSKSRKMHRGLFVYAVDGDDLNLPASDDVLKQGYRGSPYAKNFETHYPKMYAVYAYDVLNDIVKNFIFSKKYQEHSSAIGMVRTFEKNSVVIYDRLYCGYPLMKNHQDMGNHFLIRTRVEGRTMPAAVKNFLDSGKLDLIVEWCARQKESIKVRLVKVFNPKTKKVMVFATSLPKDKFSRKEVQKLYQQRWKIETVLKDLTQSLRMGQWHSKKINGILQEIYALLWFVNNVKTQMARFSGSMDFLEQCYQKSNFKLCAKIIIENIHLLIERRLKDLSRLLSFWIQRTREKRKHYSRSYPRVVKCKLSKLPVHSKVLRREAP